MPLFHAFTGCDTVSSFNGVGKKKAWESWKVLPSLTTTLLRLSSSPTRLDEAMDQVERFVVLLYNRTSDCKLVNEARRKMFASGRQIENIPPTQAALIEHTKRAIYQGSFIWNRTLFAKQELPSPALWGWQRNEVDSWNPVWSTLPEASKSCKELVKCSCKKACRPPCKCYKALFPCTELCVCSGTCYKD